MRSAGKYTLKWQATRREWIRLNPPNHEGYYVCWMCGTWVLPSEMELDHIKSRTRYPELRFVLSNLAPSCHPCNEKKGSREFKPSTSQREFDIVDELW